MSWQDLGDGSSGDDVSDRNRIQLEVRILEALGDHGGLRPCAGRPSRPH
jgi:hypothetical protein